jgi:hypothetical protein
VAGALPIDDFGGSDAEVVFVARDADGRDAGRNSTVLSPDG